MYIVRLCKCVHINIKMKMIKWFILKCICCVLQPIAIEYINNDLFPSPHCNDGGHLLTLFWHIQRKRHQNNQRNFVRPVYECEHAWFHLCWKRTRRSMRVGGGERCVREKKILSKNINYRLIDMTLLEYGALVEFLKNLRKVRRQNAARKSIE